MLVRPAIGALITEYSRSSSAVCTSALAEASAAVACSRAAVASSRAFWVETWRAARPSTRAKFSLACVSVA